MSEKRSDHLTYQLVDIGIRLADADPKRIGLAANFLAKGNVPFVVAHRVLLRKTMRRGQIEAVLEETVIEMMTWPNLSHKP